MKKLLFLFLAFILFYGCALKVTKMNPKPNISINETKMKIMLEIDASIKDTFEIPAKGGISKIKVVGWRESLKSGFNNGFGEYYSIVENKSEADLILEIKKADIEFSATSYIATSNTSSKINSVKALITYKAKLVNKTGETIGQSANTSVSKNPINNSRYCTDAVSSAVESMYELIAKDVFEK